MLHILNSQNTVLNKFVAEIRDKSIQKDSMRFRRNLERIGEVMAYEISKTFEYAVKVVETPLGFLIIFRLQVCQLLPGNLIFGHSLKYGIVTQITEFALRSLRLDRERQQQKRQTQD